MAGMLPGVECARRRRFHHQGGGWITESQSTTGNGRTRRSAFCLYTSNHETRLSASSSLQRNTINRSFQDEKLVGVAREAKERLDEKFRTKKDPETKKRQSSKESGRGSSGSVALGDWPKDVFGSKKSGGSDSKRFSWVRLGWRASDQDDCAVCLEGFKGGETLLHLPCAHRFHSRCLVPWLESNARCPCCRLRIVIE